MAERSMRLAIAGAAVAGAAVALTGVVALAKIPGNISWGVEEPRADGTVQFSISYRAPGYHSTNSHTVQLSTLSGLSAPQINGSGPVSFRLTREAGRLDCTGTARRGAASGDCAFTENPGFVQALSARGVSGAGSDELFRMALHDVGLAYVDELKRQRYATPDARALARAGEHGANLAYLQGMAGYRLDDLDGLIRARDHGVTPKYAEGLKAAGYGGLNAEDLVRLRDHGVSADFVAALQAAGYRKVPAEDLVRMRDHGVSAAWLATLKRAGYGELSVESLVRMRDHGVSAEYLDALQKAGYRRLSPAEAMRMRDHGVSAGYVEELVALGYGHLTPEELVELRDHNVTASFVRRVLDGGEKPSADDLIEMRDTGSFRTARP